MRYRLSATFAALPSTALAEVCDKVRPLWGGGDVGLLGEMLANLLSVPGLVVVAAVALAFWSRSRWLLVLLSLLPIAFATLIHIGTDNEIHALARQEGCVGPPALTLTLFVLIGVAMLVRAATLRPRSPT